jgi:type IV secretory pathway TraG/TraD family ATPase VirD4
MTLKMHWNILRGTFIVHLLIVVILVILTIVNLSPAERDWLGQIASHHLFDFWHFDLDAAWTRMRQMPSFSALENRLLLTPVVYSLWPLIVYRFHRRTQRSFNRQTVRGSQLITEPELVQRLRTAGSRLQLTGTLSVPSSFETRQFFISGAPGTGKTTLISRVIADLKRRCLKTLVYDAKGGEFVAKFYNPGTDLIYNPFDARSVHWNLCEMMAGRHSMVTIFDTISKAIIPDERSTQAQFFVDTARKIFSAVLQFCYLNEQRSVSHLADFLSAADLHSRLLEALNQVDAKLTTFISRPGSGQTQGVLSVLSQHTRVLNYMVAQPGQQELSLHDWLTNGQPGFLFLPNGSDQKESLKGIFSFFINSLATTLLSLRDDVDRRVFFLLDEVSTLERMDAIFELLKLARSKGAAFMLGLQEKSQLDHLYGEHMANSIINHCNNHIIFRANDNYTAQYASNLLGEAENETMESSYSAGYRESKDRESYHRSNRLDRLVLPSQIQTLPDLHFYLKLHGLPVAQCQLTYQGYPDVCEAFIPNEHFLSRNLQLRKTALNTSENDPKQETLDFERGRVERAEQKSAEVEQNYPLDDFKL